VFSEPGESRAYAARISPKAKALVVLVTWSDPRDRFTVSLTLLRGGHVVARSLQVAGKLRPGKLRPGKLRPGKLRITRRRGSTYTTATILSPPKGGTLKVALKAKALPAPASVATSVSLGKG